MPGTWGFRGLAILLYDLRPLRCRCVTGLALQERCPCPDQGALAPLRPPGRLGGLGPGPSRCAPGLLVPRPPVRLGGLGPGPGPSRPGPARSPASGSPRGPRPRLRPSRLGGSRPWPGPSRLGPVRTPPGLRAASSCAGRRTCRAPRVSSCLVRRITSGTRVRVMGRLLGARQTGQSMCCCTGHTGQIVRSRQSPPGYRHAVRIEYHARRYEMHRPATRSTTRFVFREPRHGMESDPREEAAMDAPARLPSKSTAIATRACGRWPSPERRRHGLARSPGALAHRCVRSGHHGAGRLRAAPTRSGRGAEHRRTAVNTSTRCHGVTLAAMTGGTADSAGCPLSPTLNHPPPPPPPPPPRHQALAPRHRSTGSPAVLLGRVRENAACP